MEERHVRGAEAWDEVKEGECVGGDVKDSGGGGDVWCGVGDGGYRIMAYERKEIMMKWRTKNNEMNLNMGYEEQYCLDV